MTSIERSRNTKTRLITVIIASLLIISFVPYACLAYSGGDGTTGNPYQIANVADFQQLSATSADWGKSFILTANINLTGLTFTKAPIAPATYSDEEGFQGIRFSGVFDGNDHTISNLTITASTKDVIGLVGCVDQGGEVKNLGIVNANITGRDYVSGLVGVNWGSLISCYATGSVSGTGTVGGLVGMNGGTLTSCYATGSVTGKGDQVGGLAGFNGGSLTSCYATGSVTGTGNHIGGLAGRNGMKLPGTITSCYATGEVTGTSAYIGGLVGLNGDTITGCFWDTQTSGKTVGVGYGTSTGVTGETTVQMKTLSIFTLAGWDFTSVWMINEGIDYPKLQSIPIQPAGNLQVTLGSAGAISAGAKWNVDGGPWLNSADTVTGLSVGSHMVNYKSIMGWTSPLDESVTISNGLTNSISRDYTQKTGQSQFGSINGKNVKLTFKDCDGNDVMFSLTGVGYGEMDTYDCSFGQIELFDTTDKSVLTISTKGKTETSVGSIIVNGSLKGIVAKTTNLRGDITVTGSLGTLTLNDVADNHTITIGSPTVPNPNAAATFTFDRVADLTINCDMPVKAISATEWLGGSIDAPLVSSITTKGDKKRGLMGDLDVDVKTSSNIGAVKVAGELSGEWNCNMVKSITALDLDTFNLKLNQNPDAAVKVLSLGTLTVKGYFSGSNIKSAGHIGMITAGIMTDSNCFAGVTEGITGLPVAEAASFDNTSAIKSIAIKGIRGAYAPFFINSNIAAKNILSASIVCPQSNNSGVPFGLAADYIKKLIIKKADGTTTSLKELNESKDSQTIDGVEIRLY